MDDSRTLRWDIKQLTPNEINTRKTLETGDLDLASELPHGHNLNDWLAINLIEFYEEINLIFNAVNEYCTLSKCPTMSAGVYTEYFLVEKDQPPQSVPAAHYVDNLMIWIENLLESEVFFPSDDSREFPPGFLLTVKAIFKRLFRVYAHIYHQHIPDIAELGLESHLTTSFLHFIIFSQRFDLIPMVDFTPMSSYIKKLLRTYRFMIR